MSLNQRFKILRKSLGLTQETFANQLNMQRAAYAKMETAKSNPTLEIIIDVLNIHNINSRWLLLGEGSMFDTPPKTTQQNIVNGDGNIAHQIITSADCNEQLHQKDIEIGKLKAQIEILKELINSK